MHTWQEFIGYLLHSKVREKKKKNKEKEKERKIKNQRTIISKTIGGKKFKKKITYKKKTKKKIGYFSIMRVILAQGPC
jgi:hypothetical protein